MAWEAATLPAFDSGWFALQAYKRTSSDIYHNMQRIPGRVKVIYRADTSNCQGNLCPDDISFEGHGSAQADDFNPIREYGGVLFAVYNDYVRVWAPDRSNIQNTATAKLVSVGDGWGSVTGEHDLQASDGFARVMLWEDGLDNSLAMSDESLIEIKLSNMNERPIVSALVVDVKENVGVGHVIGSITVEDDQGPEALTIQIVDGNIFDAVVLNNGVITVKNPVVFNYEFLKPQNHQIRLDILIGFTRSSQKL
jgi:hypothetical protein